MHALSQCCGATVRIACVRPRIMSRKVEVAVVHLSIAEAEVSRSCATMTTRCLASIVTAEDH